MKRKTSGNVVIKYEFYFLANQFLNEEPIFFYDSDEEEEEEEDDDDEEEEEEDYGDLWRWPHRRL